MEERYKIWSFPETGIENSATRAAKYEKVAI